MAILRRKKEKEEEEVKKPPKITTKKKGGRKKKQEITPWTRKERLLVFWVLAGTFLVSGFLALSARSWKLPNLPRIALPSFSETITIEGNKEAQQKADKVISLFNDQTKPLTGVYGLYVVRLNDGSEYGIREKETFQAASLIKLPVMIAAYQQAEKGKLNLDDKYSLKNADKIGGSGSISGMPAGTVFTYRELLKYMGKQSDNTAFNVLRKKLGDDLITQTIADIGMTKTALDSNDTSPYDIGLLFKKLWDGELISDEHKDELLGNITDTIYENWIKEGIPNVRVAHKFGREEGVVNDAGIVYADDPFILVIMSKGVITREADEVFPKLARIVYQVEQGDY